VGTAQRDATAKIVSGASWGQALSRHPGAVQILVAFFLILCWEAVGRTSRFAILPPLSGIMQGWWNILFTRRAAGGTIGTLPENLLLSGQALVAGGGLALPSGILLGTLMARYRKVEYLFDFYINAFMSAPTAAFIPIIVVLFGLGFTARVVVIFLYSFFVVCVNTSTGIRHVDRSLVEMARSFGATERQLFWKIMIPGAVPLIMAGIRLGIGRAVKGVINAEALFAIVGLGGMVMLYGNSFDMEKLYAVIFTIVALAYVLMKSVHLIEKRLTRWQE